MMCDSVFSKLSVISYQFFNRKKSIRKFSASAAGPTVYNINRDLSDAFGFSLSLATLTEGGGASWSWSTSSWVNLSQANWLQHGKASCFSEPLSILLNCCPRANSSLSDRPARLLSTYKDKERFELLNTCFAKSVLKNCIISHLRVVQCRVDT